jgi:hypothetical protein
MRPDALHDLLHRAVEAVCAAATTPEAPPEVRRAIGDVARECREWEESGRLYTSLAELSVALVIQGPRERDKAVREAQRHISAALRELHRVVTCDRPEQGPALEGAPA